jgi:N-acetylneuraminic acid mutarotase
VNKIIVIVLLLAFNVLTATSAGAIIVRSVSFDEITEDSWTTMVSMPTARVGLGVAVVDGKIYAIGGHTGNERTAANEVYDPASDTWSTKEQMPTPRIGFAIAAYGKMIYCIGGNVGEATAISECYDTATDSWTTKTSMPAPMIGMSANVVNGKIFVIGGNSTFAYDPETDSWTERTPAPTDVWGHASAVVDNKIYVIGGTVSNLNQIYDPKTDKWSNGTNPTESLYYAVGAATTGLYAPKRVYVLGGGYYVVGSPDWHFPGSLNLIYDPASGNWSSGSNMLTAKNGFGAAVVEDVLYVIGGAVVNGGDGYALNATERYVPVGYNTVQSANSKPFPTMLIVGAVVVVTVVGLGLLFYFKKRKQ